MSQQSSSAVQSEPETVTVIKPPSGYEGIDFKELFHYQDLFYFLVWRDIKVLYAQTILGFAWAILNPAIQIIIFSVIFGAVAKLNTDGIPYVLFSTAAVIPWTYMSESMTRSSGSLVAEQNIMGKVYFPRIIFPLMPIIAKLVDFAIAFILMIGVLMWFGVWPNEKWLLLPIFVLYMMIVPAGVGLWLSALAIRFRDVRFAMPFLIRMLIYSAPVLYSASALSDSWRIVYSINPLVGVIEGFRACILDLPLHWEYIAPGMVVSVVILISGAVYFRRMEHVFSDVI